MRLGIFSTAKLPMMSFIMATLVLFTQLAWIAADAPHLTLHNENADNVVSNDLQLVDLNQIFSSATLQNSALASCTIKTKTGSINFEAILCNFAISLIVKVRNFQFQSIALGISLPIRDMIFPFHFFW